ncbi:MAG TPA: hypothetical protein DCL21_05990 [Alphaproteobacteria bacterium]|nr:hypothetical protein [Alphaproteobacteria bacterium]
MSKSGELYFAFFGTSITEHLEAYSEETDRQFKHLDIGSKITIDEYMTAGYVKKVEALLKIYYPKCEIIVHNFGYSGGNTRDILDKAITTLKDSDTLYDYCFLEAGLNDVARRIDRPKDAVYEEEYAENYAKILKELKNKSYKTVCMTSTPFETNENSLDLALDSYNKVVKEIAKNLGIDCIDMNTRFKELKDSVELYDDGRHLNDVGDTLMAKVISEFLINGS